MSSTPTNSTSPTTAAVATTSTAATAALTIQNIDEQIVADYNSSKLDVVQIDGIVVMKIIKQCKEHLPELVPGQLLGLDLGTTLEVSNCFPFPNPRDSDEGDSSEGIAEYQLEMMRFLREVNIDSNTVGWYTPTYLNSFFNESVIETQFNYQATINQKCVVLVYDPIKTSQGTLSLRCYRLTQPFMALFKDQEFSREKLDSANLNFNDIFEQIPIKIHNSQLINALLYELETSDSMTSNFDRLNIGNNIYLEKVLEGMTDCVDSLSQELSKVAGYQRNFQQHQLQRNSFIQKKALDGQKASEAEIASHLAAVLKPLPNPPSKLTSLLLSNQINNYCEQIHSFCDGKIVAPNLNADIPIKVRLVNTLDTEIIIEQIPSKDGSFSFFNVPAGSYVLDVDNLRYVYKPHKVEVGSKSNSIKIRNDNNTIVSTPITLQPVAISNYFQQHVPFSILGFLSNPMFMMMGITGILVVVMPYMTNAIENDEEAKEAFKLNAPDMVQKVPEWHSLQISQKSLPSSSPTASSK
ncbi:Mov34/MPN/PAD-1 family protein [Cavenderia fasciculata]|uniref:Eukaryotic translation initiation factor 3 subunit H n=1 Tax=Cavenderia fasciculata TaxID=261658 RepID=F4Q0V8_CACFS|nr:Mov34/MPN/PAD-1 family protein [Cavenderia fasciculata]EGG18459.1 Mov34/MPN/PAD-1 family protein [Cavenderia fasciculata]|eukprot:XP_004366363.1 Mov34/MPN/PAD-1 family protein [Cavenderia fasciculata]